MKKNTEIEKFAINYAKEMRLKASLSQSDLAFMLNVSPGFIGKVESKQYNTKYNLNHINKLSEIFNCSPKDFLPNTFFNEKSDGNC